MMKLHAQAIYTCILCVLPKIGEVWYCSCWIVDEFMVNWCCGCYEMLLLMIHSMGIHNYGVWVVLESFMKNGWIVDLCWNDVLISSLIWFWLSF